MAFDSSTLVTDRTQQDVAYAKQLIGKLVPGTATDAEKAECNTSKLTEKLRLVTDDLKYKEAEA